MTQPATPNIQRADTRFPQREISAGDATITATTLGLLPPAAFRRTAGKFKYFFLSKILKQMMQKLVLTL